MNNDVSDISYVYNGSYLSVKLDTVKIIGYGTLKKNYHTDLPLNYAQVSILDKNTCESVIKTNNIINTNLFCSKILENQNICTVSINF